MDTDIRDEIDRSFGDGPHVDDTALLVTRGRASLRRRRLAEGGSLLLVAGAVVTVALLSSGGTPGAGSPAPAGLPTATSAADPDPTPKADDSLPGPVTSVDRDLPPGQDLAILPDGSVHMAPGVEVLRSIDNPFGRKDRASSLAVVYVKDGETIWWVGYVSRGGGGSASQPPMHDLTFREWVEAQAPIQGPSTTVDPGSDGDWPGRTDLDLVRFVGDTERLRPSEGVTITEQRAHPTLPDSFATADDRSAVAEVESEGKRWYVLARSIAGDTSPEYIAVNADDCGATLDSCLVDLRDRYAEGGGGLL